MKANPLTRPGVDTAEKAMSTLVIKDLPESTELDREAMKTIAGGTRTAGRQTPLARAAMKSRSLHFQTDIDREPFTGRASAQSRDK